MTDRKRIVFQGETGANSHMACRSVYPDYAREIEGMAAGAELDFETLFLWNCRGDLRYAEAASDGGTAAGGYDGGCTTIVVP